MSYVCDICNLKSTTKSNLNKHKKSESCLKTKKENEYKEYLEVLNKKLEKLEKLENETEIYETQLEEKNNELEQKNIEIFSLKEKVKEYKNILESLFNPLIKKENKISEDSNSVNVNSVIEDRIKILENKILQKQKRDVFENGKNVVYVITTDYKESQGQYKIGKAQDLQQRLSVYNTTDKHKVVYYTSCKNKNSMDLLEKVVHLRLDGFRIEQNKEWFISQDNANDLIKIIDECKNIIDK